MHGSASTATQDLCDSIRPSRGKPSTAAHNSGPRTQPLRRVLPPRSSSRRKMPIRPLQRKLAQKRSLKGDNAPKPPGKRKQVTARKRSAAVVPHAERPLVVSRNQPSGSTPSPPSRQRPEEAQTNIFDETGAPSETNQTSRPDNESDNPTTIALTSDGFVELLRESETRILRHIVSQQRVLLTKIEDLEAVVKELSPSVSKVMSGVSDLKVMILPSTTGTSSHRNSDHSRKQTKSLKLKMEILNDNPTLAAEMKMIFDTDLVCAATAKAVALQIVKFHSKSDSVSITARAMNVMLFGLLRAQRKSEFKSGIGLRHAEFRFKILKNFVELARKLPEDLFSLQDTTSTGEEQGEPTRKPSWLTSDLVDLPALSQARRHADLIAADVPNDPTNPEKRKGLFIAKSFMKVVVDMLRSSRDVCRVKVFEEGLFCIADWNEYKWFEKDIPNPILSFCWPEADPVPVSAIPDTTVGELDDVRDANSALLRKVILERKEMIIDAEYDVDVSTSVTPDGRKRKDGGDSERKYLRRKINILRIARTFLSCFCHTHEDNLLRTHPTMLKCIYRFALVLRGMFSDQIMGEPITRTSNERSRQNNGNGVATVPAQNRNVSTNAVHRK